MRLPPTVVRCVAFVGCVRKGEFSPKGTAFFTQHPCGPENQMVQHYIVTARHVIEKTRQLSEDATPYLRVNMTSGDCEVVRIDNEHWVFHDDDRVDVAVASIVIPAGLDHTIVKSESFATQEVIDKNNISAGNELFFPGLFVRHHGEKKNVPIVRRGSIASMPTERVETKWGNVEAYLVEARSIGGLSGSPVFVNLGPLNIGPPAEMWNHFGKVEPPEVAQIKFGPTYLLGLVHGHYGVDDILDASDQDGILSIESRSVNMGIAIVVPSIKILQMLNCNEKLIEVREEAIQRGRERKDSVRGELD